MTIIASKLTLCHGTNAFIPKIQREGYLAYAVWFLPLSIYISYWVDCIQMCLHQESEPRPSAYGTRGRHIISRIVVPVD